MRVAPWARLVGRDLRRSASTFSVAAAGIIVGVATLTFFLALSAGMREVVLGRIFPLDRVEVIPPESSVGSVLSLLGARTPGIDPEQIEALGRVAGVRAVAPRMRLAFPTAGRGGRAIFGRDVGAGEIPAEGVEPARVRPDLSPGTFFDDPDPRASHRACRAQSDCTGGEYCFFDAIAGPEVPNPTGRCSPPIPAVVSPYLVEVFNGAIAPAHNLPRLGDVLLRRAEGLVLEWDVGRAGLGSARRGTPRRIYARLVGVSPAAMELGLTVPLAVAQRLNREYAGEDAAQRFSSAMVYVADPSAVTEISQQVRALGLEVRTSGAEQMGLLVTAITAILSLASVLTVVVASFNIAQVFFALLAERRGELGLLRALGATRRDVAVLVLGQATTLGATASLAGVGLAWGASQLVNHLARTRLPAFPFKPEVWFVFGPRMVLGVLVFGVAACMLSALAPALRAAQLDPAESLTGGV
ncbi:MAG: ABC transporter permease [Myxococcales bacterium]|nr:ABC transporter permease [Myxococcales bacterium]